MVDGPPAVLVSLKPEFANAVVAGTKTVELRRRFPHVPKGTWLVLYVTKPVGAVIGMVSIEAVSERAILELWKAHRNAVALSRARFLQYFEGCSRGVAVQLGEFRAIGPVGVDAMNKIVPGFRPPQSYRYLEGDILQKLDRAQPTAQTRAGASCSAN